MLALGDVLRSVNRVASELRPGAQYGVGDGAAAVGPPGWRSGAEGAVSGISHFRSVCVSELVRQIVISIQLNLHHKAVLRWQPLCLLLV